MIMRYFLPTGSIDKIDPCAAGIEVHLPTIIFHLNYFNILKSDLYMENSAVGQQITLNKSVII